MSIRLIALDLDGTLLNSSGRVSPATARALEWAASRGIHIVFASGRPKAGLPADVTAIKGPEYAITSNGSSIFHLRENRRIFGTEMKQPSIRSVLEIIDRHPYTFEVFSEGVGYIDRRYYEDPASFGIPSSVRKYLKEARSPVEDIRSFAGQHMDRIEGLNMIVPDQAARRALIGELKKVPDLYLTASVSYYIEMADSSVSKASTLDKLARVLNVAPDEIMAFGDQDNDIEMLSYAGLGIAMKNSSQGLLSIADAVTLSNDEDGVAAAIINYIRDKE